MNAHSYTVCAVLPIPEEGEPKAMDDSFLPVPNHQTDAVRTEPADGGSVTHLRANGLEIRGTQHGVLGKVDGNKVGVAITDCRLTMACTKYDTGGQWLGGLSALALEAGDRAIAAVRRRNKMLVGQIRYPWVAGVAVRGSHGWRKPAKFIVFSSSAADEEFVTSISFSKDVDVTAAGLDLVRRVASFWLNFPDIPEEMRVELRAVTELDSLPPSPVLAGMDGVNFRSLKVSDRSALLGRENH